VAAISDGLLAVVCVACLALSRSASPIPALAVALLLLVAARVVGTTHGAVLALLPGIISIALVTLAALAYKLDAAAIFGRDPDLSGRTLIWDFAIQMVFERPWFGYGYGTFWTGIDNPGAVFWRLSHLGVPHPITGICNSYWMPEKLDWRWFSPPSSCWFLGWAGCCAMAESPTWLGHLPSLVSFSFPI
jgi:O-antigen ligase